MVENCRYKQRAGFITAFYMSPMALRIRELRASRGWTQEDLAEKVGISRSQLAQIESEARPANTLRLNAIAAALNVKVPQLFTLSPEDDRLLDAFNKSKEVDRASLVRMAEAFADQNRSEQ